MTISLDFIQQANEYVALLTDSQLRSRPDEIKKITDRLADWILTLPSQDDLKTLNLNPLQKQQLEDDLQHIIHHFLVANTNLAFEKQKAEAFLDFCSQANVIQHKTYGPDGKVSYQP